MEQARFDLKLPASQRRELAALASETGLSSADLVRLSIRYTLQHPELILPPVAAAGAQIGARSS
jgi:hypothetical protein